MTAKQRVAWLVVALVVTGGLVVAATALLRAAHAPPQVGEKPPTPVVDALLELARGGWKVSKTRLYRAACPPGWDIVADFTGPARWMCREPNAGESGFMQNCNLIASRWADGRPKELGAWYEESESDMSDVLPSFLIRSKTQVEFDGFPAFRVEYRHSFEGRWLQGTAWFAVAPEAGYVLTCTAEEAVASRYSGVFANIADHAEVPR